MPGQAIRSDQSIVMFSVADVRQHDHEDIASNIRYHGNHSCLFPIFIFLRKKVTPALSENKLTIISQ